MQRHYKYNISAEYEGYTLREFLIKNINHFSSEIIRKMLHKNIVIVNNHAAETNQRLCTGDVVEINIPKNLLKEYPKSNIELEILYENEDFFVVNKPSGIAVIQERWVHESPFKDALIAHCKKSSSKKCRPRVVHRIDKDASGAVIVSKDTNSYRHFSELFTKRKVYKEYIALVAGVPEEKGTISLKIQQANKRSNRMVISEFGKEAVTHFELLEAFRDFSLLKVIIETGRTHQIRVHMASQGYPLAIDPIYGYRQCLKLSDFKQNYQAKNKRPEKPLISRLTLHAYKMSFLSPSNEKTEIEAPLPDDFQLVLKMLRKYKSQGMPASV